MPVRNPWHQLYNPKAIWRIPRKAGVYELGNKYGTVVYIGHTSDLQDRIDDHVDNPQNDCIRKNAQFFRYEITRAHITRERTLFRQYKAKHGGKIPRCNTQDPSLWH